jgi:hypothetical protein
MPGSIAPARSQIKQPSRRCDRAAQLTVCDPEREQGGEVACRRAWYKRKGWRKDWEIAQIHLPRSACDGLEFVRRESFVALCVCFLGRGWCAGIVYYGVVCER